jgi:hypothetical protein
MAIWREDEGYDEGYGDDGPEFSGGAASLRKAAGGPAPWTHKRRRQLNEGQAERAIEEAEYLRDHPEDDPRWDDSRDEW